MENKIEKVIGVLPITNRICYGKVDKEKKLWVGNREDVTQIWLFRQYLIGSLIRWMEKMNSLYVTQTFLA